MKVYELNVWEGRSHSNFLFTSKAVATEEAENLRSCKDVTEVWLRVWKAGSGQMYIETNEPLWQK